MINQTILHYRITGRLGSGGMGVVYEAQDLNLGRRVALKFLPPESQEDQTAQDRSLLEAQANSVLYYPNICAYYSVERTESHTSFTMSLVEGPSLGPKYSSRLLPLATPLDMAIQLADALVAGR